MLNQHEIMQTIQMIDQQHLDVRTITMGISLLSCAHSDVNIACGTIYKDTPAAVILHDPADFARIISGNLMGSQTGCVRCQRMSRIIEQNAHGMIGSGVGKNQHAQLLIFEFRSDGFQRAVMRQELAAVGAIHISAVVILIALAGVKIKIALLPVRQSFPDSLCRPLIKFFNIFKVGTPAFQRAGMRTAVRVSTA